MWEEKERSGNGRKVWRALETVNSNEYILQYDKVLFFVHIKIYTGIKVGK